MSIRPWAVRTAAAGVLAAALITPLAGSATAAPTPAPAPPANPAPSNSAARAAFDQWANNRAPRLAASRATVKFTKDPNWNWGGIAPLLDTEQNAIRVELGTLPGTINRAAASPQLATALRAYRARLAEYGTALAADRAARASGAATWAKSNPAYQRVTAANNAICDVAKRL